MLLEKNFETMGLALALGLMISLAQRTASATTFAPTNVSITETACEVPMDEQNIYICLGKDSKNKLYFIEHYGGTPSRYTIVDKISIAGSLKTYTSDMDLDRGDGVVEAFTLSLTVDESKIPHQGLYKYSKANGTFLDQRGPFAFLKVLNGRR